MFLQSLLVSGLASETALFGHPELRFGSPVLFELLKEMVGGGMAGDLCLSGRTIDATEAFRIGILSKMTPPDQLMEESRAMLGKSVRPHLRPS